MVSLKFSSSHVQRGKETGYINFNNLFHITQHVQNSIISTVMHVNIGEIV